MKNSKKSKNLTISPDFTSLLTKSYVIFSLIVLLFVSGMFILANFLLSSPKIKWFGYDITNYRDVLYSGNFSKLPITSLVGDGFVEIYDVNGNLKFSSNSSSHDYTLGEIDMISEFTKNETVTVKEFETQVGAKQYLVSKNFSNNGQTTSLYMLLSEEFSIIQTNFDTLKSKLTYKEFQALTFNAKNSTSLTKYSFSASDGKTYTAIMLDTTLRKNKAPILIITFTAVAIFVIYIIMLFLFLKMITKLVRIPLNDLEIGMYRFSIGNYRQKLNYKGTREFETITHSFNDMVDILEQNKHEKEVLEEDKNRILAGLSHDLKTPITVIQGFAKALNDGMVRQEDVKKYLETIETKSEYMSELINKIYDYSKLDHPDFKVENKKTDIVEFTRQYFANKYDEFLLRGFKLSIELPEHPVYALIDKHEYPRVYDNIVSNFMKHNDTGTTFAVDISDNGENIIISLADNGKGIPENLKENLFKPFAVGDASRNTKGSGLGLAICKRIVEMCNGTILFTSNDEYKTVFEITLPSAS